MNNHFLQGIDTVILRVSNIRDAKNWYTEKIGLKNAFEDDRLKLVVLDTFSPTSLTLWQTDDKINHNPRTASYPIFRTQDATLAHHALKERGVRVNDIATDHLVTYFTFYDPDGNIVEVCQVHE